MAIKQYDSFEADDQDPSWGVATTTDGQEITTTADDAQANLAPMGPPPPPPAPPPADPGFQPGDEYAGEDQPVADPSQPNFGAPIYEMGPEGRVITGYQPGGDANSPVPDPLQVASPAAQGTGAPVADPNAALVTPATPGGGSAPFSATQGGSTDITQTVEDPAAREARAGEAGADYAAAAGAEATGKQNQALASAAGEAKGAADREAELRKQERFYQLHMEEQQKTIDAIEKHPINENEFWDDHPGRVAAAWVGLALSGFLQGATEGRNPALDQFMGALQHAQDRNIKLQQAAKESALNRRARDMASTERALQSVRMQLGPVVTKKIEATARYMGLTQLPPAATAIIAKIGVTTADAKNKIGAETQQVAHARWSEEQRATKAQPAQYAGDQQLAALGGDRKALTHAMSPAGGALGDHIAAADELRTIQSRLKELSGGTNSLPSQGVLAGLTPDSVASFVARGSLPGSVGAEGAQAMKESRQLLERAKFLLKEGKVQLFNSEHEAASADQQLGSGDLATVLKGLDRMVGAADAHALDAAATVSPGNPQGILDFVRNVHKSNPGTDRATGAGAGNELGFKPSPSAAKPAAPAAGGGAPPPLAQPPSASAPGTPTAPPPQETTMKLSDLQAIKEQGDAAGLNGDALTRIIRFESGGKPDAKNAASGATGLIQWMPNVFKDMAKPEGYENVRHEDLKDLSVEEQIPLVLQYFKDKGLPPNAGIGDMYLAVAAPGFIGKPDATAVYPKGSKAWGQNPSWRPADGGDITVGSIKARAAKF